MTNLILIVMLINVWLVIDKISAKPEFMISAEQEINGAALATPLVRCGWKLKNSTYTVCCVHALCQLS